MNAAPLCLVVDDEPDILELLVMTLNPMGLECVTAQTLEEAIHQLDNHQFDLCLTDMKLPDGNGIELVNRIQQQQPSLPVAMITAYGSVESAVQALKAGAFDFISKPLDIADLRNLVNISLKLSEQREQQMQSLVGQSAIMQALQQKVEKLARSQAPVYIKGESGSGKEVVARLIHQLGPRSDKPFVPVNCGAIPSELMESEFFGHKKGSFTGAHTDKAGLFKAANGGTLFLDEVADLPFDMQVKLLRAIQSRQIRPVGSAQEIAVDVRILSATHRDLASLVKEGYFRQDLFYRINVIDLNVPPLRERSEDLPLLIDFILNRLSSGHYNCLCPDMSEQALNALQHYSFPGNVRELENILERAMALCEQNVIQVEDLQLPQEETSAYLTPLAENTPLKDSSLLATQLDPLLDDIEEATILQALDQAKGNKTRAAELLGIGFGALRYRLKKMKERQESG